MSIFGKRFRARDKPTNSLNGNSYPFLFGSKSSGKTVNERTAMQLSVVYACVRILSEAIASLPLHFYQYNEVGRKGKTLKHPPHSFRALPGSIRPRGKSGKKMGEMRQTY